MSAATSRRPPGPRSRASSLPPSLVQQWAHEPEWLAALPGLIQDCAEQWGLELEEPFDHGRSLVVPAGDAVLKLNAPSHAEAEHEADALAFWDGDLAVRLLAHDDARRALLLERCRPGTELGDQPDVVCELLPRLWGEPEEPVVFRSLSDLAQEWADELERRPDLDRALVELALEVFRTVDAGARGLANQDLHQWNVLSAEREPWLVIDPKPVIGERELNAVGVLRNAVWTGGAAAVRRWLDALAGLGLDRERLRAWGVAHALAWSSDDRDLIRVARVIRDA
jgi:streptomycin 6-kinase